MASLPQGALEELMKMLRRRGARVMMGSEEAGTDDATALVAPATGTATKEVVSISSSSVDEPELLALSDAVEQPDLADEGAAPANAGPRRLRQRGVLQRQRRQGERMQYEAVVGFRSMVVRSLRLKSLSEAVDMHISLVQLRQVLQSLMSEQGLDFAAALRGAVDQVFGEAAAGPGAASRLSFATQTRAKSQATGEWHPRITPQARSLDLALSFWQEVQALGRKVSDEEWAASLQGMKLRTAQERRARFEEEREVRRRERAARLCLSRRAAAEARLEQRLAQRRRRDAEVRRASGLLAEVRRALLERRAAFRQRWGVAQLPAGIEMVALHSEEDAVCAVLALADGSRVFGPLRLAVQDACADLAALSALQQAEGDEVMCQELERMDIEVMAEHFLRQAQATC